MDQSAHKSILALCRQAPYGNALAREGLEAVLAAAAMDQSPELLFLGDGVFQLLNPQAAEAIQQKSLLRNLQALPMFDVETLHVCKASLQQRNLTREHLQIPGVKIELVDKTGNFITRFDHVLNF